MSEWWTYRLSSFLLFSPRTYFRLHELFNADIWPLQLVALVLGMAIVVLATTTPRSSSSRAIALILAVGWLFVAWAWELRRYATINWAAIYFAAAFALQAIVLIGAALVGKLSLAGPRTSRTYIGLAMVLFAVLVQPFIGVLAGRTLWQSQFFGVAPDPTVVATLGVLIAAQRSSWILWVVPIAWCAISGAFATMMKLPDALVMPVAAVMALVIGIAVQRTRPARASA
jgi:hypothetical protein